MKFLILFLLFMTACSQHSDFEQGVIDRALSDPITAEEYFLKEIEGGATVKEQAIFLYGMGLAHEEIGNYTEAINNYLGAEALGYEEATIALRKLQ